MEDLTVSFSSGRTAVQHDKRLEMPDNVLSKEEFDIKIREFYEQNDGLKDDTKFEDLIKHRDSFVLEDKLAAFNDSIEEYTNAKFQPYIDEYNKGKKPCRQIKTSYCEHLAKENEKLLKKTKDNEALGLNKGIRKPTRTVEEFVVQVGNKDTNSTLPMNGETMSQYADRMQRNRMFLEQFLKDFEHKYPHVDILLAAFHADEPGGTPHIHILVQFTGENYERGLSHQISMSKALELDGFSRSEKRDERFAINRWIDDVKDNVMEPNLTIFSDMTRRIELPPEEKHKGEDIRTYKAQQKALDALCDKADEVIKAIPENPLSKSDIHDLGKFKRAIDAKCEKPDEKGNITIKMPVSVARWLSSIIEKAVLFFGITLHNPLQQIRKALHKIDKSVPPSRLERHGVSINELIKANQEIVKEKTINNNIYSQKNKRHEL